MLQELCFTLGNNLRLFLIIDKNPVIYFTPTCIKYFFLFFLKQFIALFITFLFIEGVQTTVSFFFRTYYVKYGTVRIIYLKKIPWL